MLSDSSTKFDTPLPGRPVASDVAERVISDFLLRFRKTAASQSPSNIPTACVLRGRKFRDLLIPPKLLEKHQILFFLESASILNVVDPSAVVHYFEERKPWEDYDICLFDESLEWCIGITHNGDTIITDAEGVLG